MRALHRMWENSAVSVDMMLLEKSQGKAKNSVKNATNFSAIKRDPGQNSLHFLAMSQKRFPYRIGNRELKKQAKNMCASKMQLLCISQDMEQSILIRKNILPMILENGLSRHVPTWYISQV